MAAIPVPKGAVLVESPEEKALFSKINWHILPLLLVAYVFAYIDRVNIGYAQLQMKGALQYSDHVFALGASMFFVGYLLFEVPSNLLLEKIGARKTLLRIMVCWGVCATAMAWVSAPWQFYTLRFLLGAFEAGFFPGCILYFTYWYPSARRGRVISVFMTATAFASIIVGPVNGALLQFSHGFMGYQGWQWMFIFNGLPCLLIAFLCYFYLSDGPNQAGWLKPEEKKMLIERLDRESAHINAHGAGAMLALLRDPKVYVLSLIYFLCLGAVYVIVFWAPTLIQSWGVRDLFQVGLLKAIPSIAGVIGMVYIGRSSDHFNDRRWHLIGCIGLIAFGFLSIALFEPSLVVSLTLFSIATIGTSTVTPLFFAFVSEYLPKESAAGGIALISSLGNIGPAVTPIISTWILTATGNNKYSLFFIVGLYVTAAVIIAFAAQRKTVASHAAPAGQPA